MKAPNAGHAKGKTENMNDYTPPSSSKVTPAGVATGLGSSDSCGGLDGGQKTMGPDFKPGTRSGSVKGNRPKSFEWK